MSAPARLRSIARTPPARARAILGENWKGGVSCRRSSMNRHGRQYRRRQSVFERSGYRFASGKRVKTKDYQCGGSLDAAARFFISMTSTLRAKKNNHRMKKGAPYPITTT